MQNPLKHNIADQHGEGSNTENAEVGIQDCPTSEAHINLPFNILFVQKIGFVGALH